MEHGTRNTGMLSCLPRSKSKEKRDAKKGKRFKLGFCIDACDVRAGEMHYLVWTEERPWFNRVELGFFFSALVEGTVGSWVRELNAHVDVGV